MSFLSKVTVEPVAFLFILTIYIEYTAVQDVIYIKTCHRLYANYSDDEISDLCLKSSSIYNQTDANFRDANVSVPTIDKDEISRLTAIQMKYYMASFSICAVIASLWAGSWSDYYGRKRVLILPSFLGIFAEGAFILCSYYLNDTNATYYLIYIAAIFNGISGGSTTVISSCFGYVSDVTVTKERSTRITFLESALFIGGFLGYNLAGILIKYAIGSHYYSIFGLCIVLHAIIIAYVMIYIKETRGMKTPTNEGTPINETLTNEGTPNLRKMNEEAPRNLTGKKSWLSFDHVTKMLSVIFKRRPARNVILLLCLCSAISSVTLSVQLTLTYVFVKRSPLKWDTYLYSVYNSVHHLVSGISLIIILPLSYYKFGPKDALFSSLGFFSKAIGLCNFGASITTGQTFATIALLALSEFTMPAIRSLMSKLVSVDERAKAFSFLGSLQNLVQFLASLIFPTIFTLTSQFFPGLVFQVAALLQTFAAVILM